LPTKFTEIATFGALNTHPSLLPDYRGTSITRWQVLEGVQISGVTIHIVESSFDTGAIISKASLALDENDTPQKAFSKLSVVGAELALNVLTQLKENRQLPEGIKQGSGKYYPRWSWDHNLMRINLKYSLKQIHHFILANTQEDYRYGGPRLRVNESEYYVRESEIRSQGNRISSSVCSADGIYAKISSQGYLEVRKLGDESTLVIKKIQRVGGGIFGFRAHLPSKFESNKTEVKINEC